MKRPLSWKGVRVSNIRLSCANIGGLRSFKTQMLALGVQPDYVDYFMGHTVDTYHDIQSLGIDRMRSIYAAAGFAIRKKNSNPSNSVAVNPIVTRVLSLFFVCR